ncbi:hypothetical protein [Yoonia sp. 208BN28-4]|uniref:hypothetical protein n=1 Tax=Yoonia sp. 208BN28-4 TaxID=3126505 RepID=UPI00309809E9
MRKRYVLALALLGALAGCAAILPPTIKAGLCPSCYGLGKVADRLYVDPAATPAQIAQLRSDLAAAKMLVEDRFDLSDLVLPDVIVCLTEPCHTEVDNTGRLAAGYGAQFI